MVEGQGTAGKPGDVRQPDPLIGRVIADRFKIVSLIARGGMGKVYRAEQMPLGRVCAIKVLNPAYNGDADPEFHRRFYREASVTSKITHPNSVTIFDYGKTDDDIFFMAMEYLEGQTLHMALREAGVMNEQRVGKIATQICKAVREAHKLEVIHRDLKPANIFLTHTSRTPDASGELFPPGEDEEDFVKVLDFGLVKHLAERPEEQLTQTGLFMGSPKYMAPEQIQGGHVDARTDIYSLGIILYEMLAGKVPFERATSVNILMAHVGEPPPPMREVNPNLLCSPAFEELVMTCIAKDPDQRFASMDQVLAAIRRAHGGAMTGQITAVASGHWALQRASASMPVAQQTGPGQRPPMPSAPGYPTPQAPPYDYPSAPVPPHTQPMSGHSPAAVATGSGPTGPHVSASSSTDHLRAPGVFASATGSHSQLVRLAPNSERGPGLAFEQRPRSRSGIAFGVVIAAIVGAAIGLGLFQATAPEPTSAPSASVSVAPSPPSPPPPPSASEGPKTAGLKATTDPVGAAIREDNKEICASTPCDLVFADATKPHKLLVLKAGYRAELRTVKQGDAPLVVKLVHLGGIAPQPAPSAKKSDPAPTPSTRD